MFREEAKKLVSVLTISTLVIENSEKAILVSAKELEQVICIQYSIAFLGDVIQDGLPLNLVLALFNSSNEVNVMHPAFAER